MQVVIARKKKYIILLLITLVLAAVTAGIYLFFNPKTNGSTSYTVDKYSDVTNWCETSLKEGTLISDCKALLINIDSNSCFEVQVITKDKELKDLNVCEKNDTLSYTNDVLGYKKLMPVDVIFTYSKEGVLGDYSFKNVSFGKVDDTYIQNIVIEDINSLITTNFNSEMSVIPFENNNLAMTDSLYVVKNSVDVCPTPGQLVSLVNNEQAISQYKDFYNKNRLPKENYKNLYNNFYDNSILEAMFACDSAKLQNYNLCDFSKKIKTEKIPNLSFNVKFQNEPDEIDKQYIKYISNFYDGTFNINIALKEKIQLEDLIISITNKTDLNENVMCSLYKLLQKIENTSNMTQAIESILHNNVNLIESPLCAEIALADNAISKEGIYLKMFYANKGFIFETNSLRIYYDCINLSNLIK